MHQLMAWFSSNTAALSIMGAAIAFIWSTTQQMAQRKADAREREFQAFHKLVAELVAPDPAHGVTWIDRQAAIIFELRHFEIYYEFIERMLVGLRKKWTTDPNFQWPSLVEEIDFTLAHIQQNK